MANDFSQQLTLGTNLVLPKTSGVGIQVDTTTPTFGWRDITAALHARTSGAAVPSLGAYAGTSVYQYYFSNSTTQELFIEFHVPHDYVPGTDIHIHVHWSQTTVDSGGTAGAPGAVKWSFDVLYAKGHSQTAFPGSVTTVTVTQTASGTIRMHQVAEVQLTTSGAIGGIPIEVDGVILARVWRDPTDAADTLNQVPYAHFCDLHYQSNNMATKAKAPNFYV